jgi:hypothetical protein
MKRKNINWDDDFANFKRECLFNGKINNVFPSFIEDAYNDKKTSFNFLKRILRLEREQFKIFLRAADE